MQLQCRAQACSGTRQEKRGGQPHDLYPRRTYDAAAHDYDGASRSYWEFCSSRTVERLTLREGEEVLDVACGPGPSALLAAERVGPSGRVVGVDIAEQMLAIARRHAAARGLGNVTFELGDMTMLPFPAASFDAVVCVLGIFLVDDLVGAARSLWRLVRPGGRLAVTTLGTNVFSPAVDAFVDAARAERSDLDIALPWRRTEDPEVLRAVLVEGGVHEPDIAHEEQVVDLPAPVECWRLCSARASDAS